MVLFLGICEKFAVWFKFDCLVRLRHLDWGFVYFYLVEKLKLLNFKRQAAEINVQTKCFMFSAQWCYMQ